MTADQDRPGGDGVIAVIRQKDRYLMIQRAPGILAGGMWCFVGGGVHAGETQEQAVVREVREEVDLVVEPDRKLWECLSPNRKWQLHVWATVLLSADIVANPDEVADYRWLTRSQIAAWPDLLPSVHGFFEAMDDALD